MPPSLWPDHEIFLQATLYKRCIFCQKWVNLRFQLNIQKQKVCQLQGGFAPLIPRPGALPLDPAGAPPLDPRYRLALCALAMASLCQILNTPPAFFWLQFKRRQDTVVGNHEHWTV